MESQQNIDALPNNKAYAEHIQCSQDRYVTAACNAENYIRYEIASDPLDMVNEKKTGGGTLQARRRSDLWIPLMKSPCTIYLSLSDMKNLVLENYLAICSFRRWTLWLTRYGSGTVWDTDCSHTVDTMATKRIAVGKIADCQPPKCSSLIAADKYRGSFNGHSF